MNNLSKYWDNVHLNYKSSYDNWMDKYLDDIKKDFKIIELGCGRAYNSIYLLENGYNVIACDFSKEVISILNKELPSLKTKVFDMTDKFPFNDSSFDIVIADLCLHYFDEKQTINILEEIKRILKPNGYMIGRINSSNDKFHIPEQAEKIETNFYYDGKIYKRFFESKDFETFFKDFKIINLEEKVMDRYEKTKILWEFKIKKV